MTSDRLSAPESHRHLFDTAWFVLDAANDLCDSAAVDACRRVIDAIFRGVNIIDKIIRDLSDSGGIENIKIDKSLISLVGLPGLEPGTRPL
jgi:hypothetical protein